MTEKTKCRRCSGSGEFAGGVCFSCNGDGEVSDVRYQTTSAKESSHPALRADREEQPVPGIPADPEEAKVLIEQCKAELDPFMPRPKAAIHQISQHDCEHDFYSRNYYMPVCSRCGMAQVQFLYSVQAEPDAWERR